MDNDALSLLLRHVDEDRANVVQAMTEGAVSDFQEFQSLRGQLKGLARARMRIEDMRSRLQREAEG